MRRIILLSMLIGAVSLTFAQSQGEKVMLDLMQEYDPQNYGYYQYNDGIKTQGKQIAQSIANQLTSYSNLIATEDPQVLLNDFANKINNIEMLNNELDNQATNYLNNRSSEMGNQLNSGDYMGAFANLMGSIEGYSEMKKTANDLEKQKLELQKQKEAQLSEIYQKKFPYTKQTMSQMRQRAAFAESKAEEDYYLKLVDYVWCNYYSTNCSQPQKSTAPTLENKFMAKDAQLRQISDRKFQLQYDQWNKKFSINDQSWTISDGVEYFYDASVAFAAKAANEFPTAENYVFLAEKQSAGWKRGVPAFASMMVAQSLDLDYVSNSHQTLFDELKTKAKNEIKSALSDNDIEYLGAFLQAGLDKTIRFDGKSLLVYAISVDNPDAVQLILNQYIEGLYQPQIAEKVQKAIMLSVAQDSPKTLQRFLELGVSPKFTLGNYTPISLAAKLGSTQTMEILLDKSGKRASYEVQYANSPGMVLITAGKNPVVAVDKIKSLSPQDLYTVTKRLLERMYMETNLYKTYSLSEEAKNKTSSSNTLQKELNRSFIAAIGISYGRIRNRESSLAADFFNDQLVQVDGSQLLGDLIDASTLVNVFSEKTTLWGSPLITFEKATELCNESLPFAALYFGNKKLWEKLDELFELSKITNKTGRTLKESIDYFGLSTRGFLSNKLEMSFESEIEKYVTSNKAWPLPQYINRNFNIEIDTWRAKDGGTILHVYVGLASKLSKTLDVANFSLGNKALYAIDDLVELGVDKSVLNNKNETALNLLLQNEELLKKAYAQDFKKIYKTDKLSRSDKKAIDNWWDGLVNELK